MSNKVKITTDHLETIYRIMLKRIGKGYSAERLSALIGKDHNYIEEVESFILPTYPAAELDRIALALEESNQKSFYAEVHDDTYINISCERHYEETRLVHVYSIVNSEDEKFPFITVRENLFVDLDNMPHGNENKQIAEEAVRLLIRSGYFMEAKMPLEVFHSVNNFLSDPMHPIYVERALMGCCGDVDNVGELKRVENATDGFKYEEC